MTADAVIAPDTPQVAVRPVAHGAVRRFVHKPLAMAAAFVIVVMVAAVALADVIAPYDPLKQDLRDILAGPSWDHLLGTDTLGRDVFSRLLFGGRPVLIGALVALITFLIAGVALGLLAGYIGGRVDRIIMAFTDGLIAIPGIVLVLAVLAMFEQNLTAAMAIFGFLASGALIRIVRSAAMSLREELFISAAKVSGLSNLRIMVRHVAPGLAGPIIVQAALFAGAALTIQTGLGYLGLGALPPQPSWGGMIHEAATVMVTDSFMLYVTGGVIAILVVAFGLFGDGVRDVTAETRRSVAPRRGGATRTLAADAVEAGAASDAPLLEVRDCSIGFDQGSTRVDVVKGISFTVDTGEIVGLVGESGSGKTVTALSMLGLLPGNGGVTGGDILLHGQSIVGLDSSGYRELRGRRIGYVSQEPMVALDPMLTVRSQLSEVLRNFTPRADKGLLHDRCVSLLESVRLPDPEGTLGLYPHQLSGGMAQRVVIAIALAGDPDLLIADEPTTALDVTVQAEILDLLLELRESSGKAVLLVTHDLAVVADVCDRAIVMSHGELVERASVDDLFYRPEHEYTRRLIASTPSPVGTS